MQTKTCISLLLLLFSMAAFSQQKGYYRTPAIHGNTVVFTAEGDLWKYNLVSGLSTRLTTNSGVEEKPLISPDGKQVVFTGQYEGSTQLYGMSIDGGVPKRLTYDYDDWMTQPVSWTKSGAILYRTDAFNTIPNAQLVLLNPATLARQVVPLAQASLGCYDEDSVLFFTRLPNQGSKTKRYKGGFIEQIWKFDGRQEAVNLTGDFDGTSTSPMILGSRLFFISDRDGTLNLWSMNKQGKDLKQQTFFKGWDVQSPTTDGSRIVYQKGADIWLYDVATNSEKLLDIQLVSDFDQRKPKWIKSPVTSITGADISPNGAYAAIISRGRIFVSPAKSDRWQEINRKSGIRFREVHFMNDKMLAALSDAGGEYEVYQMKADGSDTAIPITRNTKTIIAHFTTSPNGKYIAFADKNDTLRIANVADGAVKYTYGSAYSGMYEMSWSPDSRYLQFTQGIANLNAQICLVDVRNMQMQPLTTARLNSYSPSWSADSNWLYFVSERHFATQVSSPWGSRQPEPFYANTANIYAMPLDSSKSRFPFLQTDSWMNDTVFNPIVKEIDTTAVKDKKKKAITKPADKQYNWDYAKKVLFKVPVKSGNIGSVAVAADCLYWLEYPTDQNDPGGSKLFALKIKENKKYEPVEVASGVSNFSLSANRKKLLVSLTNKMMAIADASGEKIDMDKSKLQLANWSFVVEPQQDWKQLFDDAWRMLRDYFYDRNLHGVNWTAVYKQYAPLVNRLTDRYELDDLLGQMAGELSALHTFVGGGDKRRSSDQIQIGCLGAEFTKVPTGFRIDHIYQSDPDYPETASPLGKPELRVKEGDIITAINNASLKEMGAMEELLANKTGQPVKLNLTNAKGKTYEQVVTPFGAGENFNLHYGEWELRNRAKVDSMAKEDIGYIHLRAMSGSDMDDFVKQFYPVFNRKGLIIDVRNNWGGNIDSWVLEKLMRKAWMYWQGRSGGPTWNMQYAFRGHMVLLCDQQTASDGEAVSEGFRRLGLGKVIGMRTWGGEIWLSMDNLLVDNGIASAAEMGVYGPEGQWLIEGRGVEPDIAIDNLPHETFKGKDAQLEYAVDYLKKLIKEKPIAVPAVPKFPDKHFDYGKIE